MTAGRALAAATSGCRMVGGERLHVAQKIDGRGIAPFDPDDLCAERRKDARSLWPHLQPGQVDDSYAVECATFCPAFITHSPSPSGVVTSPRRPTVFVLSAGTTWLVRSP